MDQHRHLMETLATLYAEMDQAYEEAARKNGFTCNGCEENCCRTLFYHHTLAEYLYLQEGLGQLSAETRRRLAGRAIEVRDRMHKTEAAGRPVSEMCPLNEDERCMLYTHRPMICRLHGIPHRLQRPGGQSQVGPGCGEFDRQCGLHPQVLLDRTPLYTAMAQLERRVRALWDYQNKIKMTLAEMIATIFSDDDGGPLAAMRNEIHRP